MPPKSTTSSSRDRKPSPGGTRPASTGARAGRAPAKTGASAATGAKAPATGAKAPAKKEAAPVEPKKVVEKQEAISLIDDKPARKELVNPDVLVPTRSGLAPITGLRKMGKAAAVVAPVVEPEPIIAKPEVLDLIGPKPIRPPAAESGVAPIAESPLQAAAPAVADDVQDEKIIHIKPPIIVRELAAQLGLKPFQLISELMELNIFAAINHAIEPDVATQICAKHGFIFALERREKGGGVHKVEAVVEAPPPPVIEKEDELKPRPPIITFMGHVDHGKTSLMDSIRKARVAVGEAGGITQHIGAYSVEHKENRITFLDTPGHAAFTAMRARGATVTDIVVLVVAADDGIMPQTMEALNHAKAANVSIMVAINKIDLNSANIDRVKGQLQEQGLTPEDWGGETICVPVSATKGTGIDDLLEMMLLQAEVLELKSSPSADARGRVIEARMEAGRGPTATIIVQMGTLKVGDSFICGDYFGKVKSLLDHNNKPIKSAGPSTPVQLLGFSGLVNAGDELVVMESERDAKALSEERLIDKRSLKLTAPSRPTLESILSGNGDDKKRLLLILKGDVQGSVEALVNSLGQIPTNKIDLDIIHAAVGPISENDILLASASSGIIIGFNVKIESVAVASAKREGVQVKLYSIIYELIDQVKEAMAGLLDPETRETVIGHAEVKQVFDVTKGRVAGCMVTDGRISRTARARATRGKQAIFDGPIGTLRRFQDDVKEVRAGVECGIKLGEFNDYEVGDVIECYQLDKVPQQL